MGYTRFSLKYFSRRFWPFEMPDLAPALDVMGKGKIAHGSSLPVFLIFCKNLH